MREFDTVGTIRTALCLGFALSAAACSTASVESPYIGDPGKGRLLAERVCSDCHSIEAVGASANPDAPPLRDVLASYPADQLADDLQKAEHISFLRMPQIHLGEHGGDDLVAYIASINIE